jgi:GH15 family glucan-1,4-alpha-glucosidase
MTYFLKKYKETIYKNYYVNYYSIKLWKYRNLWKSWDKTLNILNKAKETRIDLFVFKIYII